LEIPNQDTSAREADKKIFRMSHQQLREYVRDCEDDHRQGSV
jgi:hypothetical protein